MDNKANWPPETSLALKTRIQFVHNALLSIKPESILDIGCGTGEHLTRYVAQLFPYSKVYGVDSDPSSIDFAKRQFSTIQNLHFFTSIPKDILFDAIIASEIMEHVENPYQFLIFLRSKLRIDGVLILTVPNGYGCSELMALMESLVHLSGMSKGLRKIKHALRPNRKPQKREQDTLAISPHINFFTFKRLLRIFFECGFRHSAYQGRMLLHNYVCSVIIDKSEYLARINALLGSKLPARIVSDWMFVLRKEQTPLSSENRVYKRNVYEKIRKYLNYKRYALS